LTTLSLSQKAAKQNEAIYARFAGIATEGRAISLNKPDKRYMNLKNRCICTGSVFVQRKK
jgi:hypothetical protein